MVLSFGPKWRKRAKKRVTFHHEANIIFLLDFSEISEDFLEALPYLKDLDYSCVLFSDC